MISIYVVLVAAAVAVLVAKWRQLFDWCYNRARIYYYMAKITGPPSLPIVGTTYKFKLDRVGTP